MARPPPSRRGRWLRIIAFAAGGVIALAIAGAAITVATFDPNSHKAEIIAAVRSATGRELTIGGTIGLSISLSPTLELSDVSFSNPPGFSRPQMATLHQMELQLSLIPLLSRKVRIERLVLAQPDILLETNAQGERNWHLGPAGTPPTAAGTASVAVAASGNDTRAPLSIGLSSVEITGGTLGLRDASGRTMALVLTKLTAEEATPIAPLHLTLDATYNGAPVSLTADTGSLAGLMGRGDVPWPIKLAAVAAGAKFNAEGTVAQPAAGQGLAITVTADIPDLAALSPLAGTALPPLKTITAQFKLADTNGGDGIAISDLTVTLPQADLTGSASVRGGVRPLITANLSAKQIDLDAINGAVSTAPAAAPGKPSAPATRSDHVIPDGKLPFDVLRRVDTDLQLAVDDLRSGGQDYKSVKLHAVSKDGKLTVDPLTLGVPGGQMDLTATVDANPDVPLVSVTARAPSLSLQPLLKALNKPGYASGTLELRADLRGAGDTPKAIVASLDGPIGVAVAKGQIDSQLLGGMMSWLVQKTDLSKLANLAGMSTLNCFAVRIDTRSGIGTLQALRLDTSTFDMSGRGTLNFATEAIDLHLRPMISIVGTQIATPVIVRGSFANPYVEPDPVGAVTSNAEAAAELALGAGTGGLSLIIGAAVDQTLSGDACAGPLALARFSQAAATSGQSGGDARAAPQPSKKPNNPFDALKKLFQ